MRRPPLIFVVVALLAACSGANTEPSSAASEPRSAAPSAQSLSTSRREAARPCPKLHPQSMSWRVVLTLLEWKWSPQHISGTLKRMWPNDPTQHVSHETIYTVIYAQPRGELRRPSLSPVCATVTAPACHASGALTDAARSPIW